MLPVFDESGKPPRFDAMSAQKNPKKKYAQWMLWTVTTVKEIWAYWHTTQGQTNLQLMLRSNKYGPYQLPKHKETLK